ncbi:MAG: recombinase family protein [Brevinema sp.]
MGCLHDFSKLVEVFDKYNTSFVSITQQFNTSTSMGRLTLNMLLSFAQFEREVTGERIRDKKKAMAMKGMWSAGVTPFGYDRVDKKLIPNPDHAERVRKIFELYIELRSVNAVKRRLQELNIQTQNGRDWSDGNLYNILQRKLYLGKIEHHKEVYDGQHEAIVDKEVFHKVQQIISENRRRSASKLKGKHNSLLGGKIFDSEGWAMSPSHSVKGGVDIGTISVKHIYRKKKIRQEICPRYQRVILRS